MKSPGNLSFYNENRWADANLTSLRKLLVQMVHQFASGQSGRLSGLNEYRRGKDTHRFVRLVTAVTGMLWLS